MSPQTQAPAKEAIDAVYVRFDRNESADAPFCDDRLLQVSLRSLARYAPWIRKVHLVTNGAAPGWIKRQHPRLELVRHEDLFRDRSALPTFNLHAVEWQLFRIPGLSRQFLYVDGDFFLGQSVAPGDFLTPKGGYRFFVEPFDMPAGSAAESLLNSRFGNRSPRKQPAPVLRFLDKTLLEEVNRLWEVPIKRTAGRRFSDPQDVSLETLYFYYLLECPQQYRIHEQAAVADYEVVKLSPARVWKPMAALLRNRPKFFRLSIQSGAARDAERIGRIARGFLKLCYWRRSAFEGVGKASP